MKCISTARMVTLAAIASGKMILGSGSLYTTQIISISIIQSVRTPSLVPSMIIACRQCHCHCRCTQSKKKKRKRLPQLIPLLRAGRRSKAVAASMFFHVLCDVLPWKLVAAANAVVCSFCAELLGVSDATAEEPNLLLFDQHHSQ